MGLAVAQLRTTLTPSQLRGGLVNVADTGGRAGRGLSLHPETFSGESERESQAEDDGPPVLASTLTDALAIFREPPPPPSNYTSRSSSSSSLS